MKNIIILVCFLYVASAFPMQQMAGPPYISSSRERLRQWNLYNSRLRNSPQQTQNSVPVLPPMQLVPPTQQVQQQQQQQNQFFQVDPAFRNVPVVSHGQVVSPQGPLLSPGSATPQGQAIPQGPFMGQPPVMMPGQTMPQSTLQSQLQFSSPYGMAQVSPQILVSPGLNMQQPQQMQPILVASLGQQGIGDSDEQVPAYTGILLPMMGINTGLQGGFMPFGQGGIIPAGQGGINTAGYARAIPNGQGGILPAGQGGIMHNSQGSTTPVGQAGINPNAPNIPAREQPQPGSPNPSGHGGNIPVQNGETMPAGVQKLPGIPDANPTNSVNCDVLPEGVPVTGGIGSATEATFVEPSAAAPVADPNHFQEKQQPPDSEEQMALHGGLSPFFNVPNVLLPGLPLRGDAYLP
ncbi:amelotin isoform X2 [Protopterus annectens]|uniref:amelotin isoform X2 n=1 Tax=Protopterus annectens TaxID=7888 RepID=UPI001CFB11CA|nr:amelotin isoform X2 [Protopterus annectens]